ncbi:hypothetical protein QQ045_026136 [Rhodiola kirilowii]
MKRTQNVVCNNVAVLCRQYKKQAAMLTDSFVYGPKSFSLIKKNQSDTLVSYTTCNLPLRGSILYSKPNHFQYAQRKTTADMIKCSFDSSIYEAIQSQNLLRKRQMHLLHSFVCSLLTYFTSYGTAAFQS